MFSSLFNKVRLAGGVLGILGISNGGSGSATAAGARSNLGVPGLATANVFTKTNSITPVSLSSSGASIAVDAALSNLFKHTLTENTTLATPSNLVEGTTYFFYFKQHASSAKTLAFSSAYLFVGGTDPVIAATAGALLIISATYIDGVLVCVFNQNFA